MDPTTFDRLTRLISASASRRGAFATLPRATLPPGGEVPPPAAGTLVLDIGAFGDADIAK
jgi:hypothetical protein